MSDENHSLEELQQKAKFLREEKQRIIKAKREQEAIKRLQAEIKNLQSPNPESRTRDELLSLGKKGLKNGIGVLKKARRDLLDNPSTPEKTPIEKDLEQAQISGLWPNDEPPPTQDRTPIPQPNLEQKWQAEKLRLREEKSVKAQQAAISAEQTKRRGNEGCLAVIGTLAWFIPILWPVAIYQLFKTYPTTCFTVLGIFTFLIIVISSLQF